MPKARKSKVSPSANRSQSIVSIADLARHLDLSAWTVSRAINGHPEVKEETKQRIREAMTELGFRPNLFARGLRGRGSGMVGVCFAGLGSPILNKKIYHLQEFLRRTQLRSLMEVTLRDPQNEARVIEDFLNVRVEGIVLIHSTLPPKVVTGLLSGVACVCVDPHEPQKLPSVSLDRRKAMELLLDHLLGFGHRSIALLGVGRRDAWRWPALAEHAVARGLDPDRLFTELGDAPPGEESIIAGRAMATSLLQLRNRPTAALCVDDRVAIGAVQCLHEAGLKVPGDISVTGFDNLDVARQLRPTLTSVEQNPVVLMETAGAMLLEQIGQPVGKRGRAESRLIEPLLVTGESSGPARR